MLNNSTTTKSGTWSKMTTPRDSQKGSKNKLNEYGLRTQKSGKNNVKSFNRSSHTLTSIFDEKPMLNEKEISRYLNMLNNYVKNEEDSKTIMTLKILLNHFMRKYNQSIESGKTNEWQTNSSSCFPNKRKFK